MQAAEVAVEGSTLSWTFQSQKMWMQVAEAAVAGEKGGGHHYHHRRSR